MKKSSIRRISLDRSSASKDTFWVWRWGCLRALGFQSAHFPTTSNCCCRDMTSRSPCNRHGNVGMWDRISAMLPAKEQFYFGFAPGEFLLYLCLNYICTGTIWTKTPVEEWIQVQVHQSRTYFRLKINEWTIAIMGVETGGQGSIYFPPSFIQMGGLFEKFLK